MQAGGLPATGSVQSAAVTGSIRSAAVTVPAPSLAVSSRTVPQSTRTSTAPLPGGDPGTFAAFCADAVQKLKAAAEPLDPEVSCRSVLVFRS